MSTDHTQDAAALFPPHVLREYALLADGERGALVGPRGDIAWMCAPQWHDDAGLLLTDRRQRLLRRDSGRPRFVWGGYYEDGSLIWRSRWITDGGRHRVPRSARLPRRPAPRCCCAGSRPVDAPARVRVLLDAAGRFRAAPHATQLNATTPSGPPAAGRCTCAGPAAAQASGPAAAAWRSTVDLAPGEHHDLVLEMSEQRPGRRTGRRPGRPGKPPRPPGRPRSRSWAPAWRPATSRHSYAVLRGLTSSGGGMVAAATMRLPERAEAGRNYDYRYVWIRDQCYAGQAVAADGPHRLLDDAVDFVAARIARRRPRAQARLHDHRRRRPGRAHPVQLAGYPGGSDKAGNWVNQQFQLDAFGRGAAAVRRGRPPRPSRQPRTGGRPRPRSRPSRPGRPNRTPACGNWTTGAGPTPG